MANVVGAVWIEDWGEDGYRVFLRRGDTPSELVAAGLCKKYAEALRGDLSSILREPGTDLHPVYLRDLVLDVIGRP